MKHYIDNQKRIKIRNFGIILTIFGFILTVTTIVFAEVGTYQLRNEYTSYWNLADKASTIEQKSMYVDEFVKRLGESNLFGQHNAIFLKTPNNSFNYNYNSILSLQSRLHEIKSMNPSSFEYNTAIYQITQQELQEANNVIGVIASVWWLSNYPLLWDWLGVITTFSLIMIMIMGIRYWNYGNWD